MTRYVVGIDLGGTKIATCLMDEEGCIVKKIILPTLASEGPEAVIGRMKASVYEVMKQAKVDRKHFGCRVGSPGPMDSEKGIIKILPLAWMDSNSP